MERDIPMSHAAIDSDDDSPTDSELLKSQSQPSDLALSREQVARYCRQLVLPELGFAGQQKLLRGRVLCVGTGGLGSPLDLYLAAAGIGHIGIVDTDNVDFSNLQRQVIHFTPDVGTRKVKSAAAKLHALNPMVDVLCYDTTFTAKNAMEICAQYDVIVDASDNFATRYLTNDAGVLLGKPVVYASIFRFEGQASVFDAKKGPCYRCLYPEPPAPHEAPGGAELGILGVVPGFLGLVQATEVMKLLLGIGDPLIGRLLTFDALEMRMREMHVHKDPDCLVCGHSPSIRTMEDSERFCSRVNSPAKVNEIEPRDAFELYERGQPGLVFLDVRGDPEWNICRIDGAKHIPFAELDLRLAELDPKAEIIVYCLTGARSRNVVERLQAMGFSNPKLLKGGLRGWAASVDPDMWIY